MTAAVRRQKTSGKQTTHKCPTSEHEHRFHEANSSKLLRSRGAAATLRDGQQLSRAVRQRHDGVREAALNGRRQLLQRADDQLLWAPLRVAGEGQQRGRQVRAQKQLQRSGADRGRGGGKRQLLLGQRRLSGERLRSGDSGRLCRLSGREGRRSLARAAGAGRVFVLAAQWGGCFLAARRACCACCGCCAGCAGCATVCGPSAGRSAASSS